VPVDDEANVVDDEESRNEVVEEEDTGSRITSSSDITVYRGIVLCNVVATGPVYGGVDNAVKLFVSTGLASMAWIEASRGISKVMKRIFIVTRQKRQGNNNKY
jgi:hypothetical protein